MADITPLAFRGEGRSIGRISGLWGELLSEFFGTFVLIAFGDGVVAVAVAGLPGSGRTAGPTTIFNAAGDWLLITWGWAMAVAFGVWVAGGVSGAHLNPAVTLAFAVRRRFAWAKVLPYMAAQVIGAFVGAAVWRLLEPAFPWMGDDPTPYVIVGMMCCFGSIARAPLAVMLMVAEMTGSIGSIEPGIIAVGLAWLIVSRGEQTMYRSQLISRAAHDRPPSQPDIDAAPIRHNANVPF